MELITKINQAREVLSKLEGEIIQLRNLLIKREEQATRLDSRLATLMELQSEEHPAMPPVQGSAEVKPDVEPNVC